ncbi:EAL domain-containing protein [Simiduia curdlanivorans]|uniref:EAL domain-containing protein n=1 Tax=Simiduia curdlanivorans TaxID=1492769 RepID=A0ABV8V6E4_9GAMM|nr:EAL domain-containing protein [Simiduia curdlanivorans]MDN3638421.1 EAL domain-containing protein [Simiduia curdlanivorans]
MANAAPPRADYQIKLYNFHKAILRYKSTAQLFEHITRDAVQIGDLHGAWIGALDPEKCQIVSTMAHASDPTESNKLQALVQAFPFADLVLSPTFFDSGDAKLYDYLSSQTDDNFWHSLLTKNKWQSAAALPLFNEAKVFGILVLIWHQQQRFDTNTKQTLIDISTDASSVISASEASLAAERATQELEKYETLFQNAGWSMAIADPESHQLIYSNLAFATMHGYTQTEMRKLNLADTFSIEARKQLPALAARAEKEGSFSYETKHLRKNGTSFDCKTHVTAFKDDQGKVMFRAACLEDLTEQKLAQAQVQQLLEQTQLLLNEKNNTNQLLESIFNRVTDCFVALDNHWRFTYINQRAQALFESFGIEKQLIGTNIWDEFPPVQDDPFHAAYYKAVDTQQAVYFEHYYEPWGRWFENRVYPSEDGLTIYFTDTTKSKKLEQKILQSNAIYEKTFNGVMITDLQGNILAANPAFSVITGYSEAEILGQNARILSANKHAKEFYAEVWKALENTGSWQGEIWNRRKSGDAYPEWITINRVHHQPEAEDRYLAIFSDISKIKQNEAALAHLAHHDALTGLPNRVQLYIRLKHSMDIAKRNNTMLALLMFDLDHFKYVNDSFGHAAGDQLLKLVTEKLTKRFREQDCLCRLGGDEFTLVLDNIASPDAAARVAEEIIHMLSQPWRLVNEIEVRISASVGISLYPSHGNNAEELLQQADTSLYSAKAEGRARYKFFNQELTKTVRARLEIEAELRHAIQNNELLVYYQPQYDTSSNTIVGAEALVRWAHPSKGLIPPIYFIPVAEATGLISAIGNWVLNSACQQCATWFAQGLRDFTLAVNLSPYQFLHGDIEQNVAATTAKTGFPAQHLELEITEGTLMDREIDAIKIFTALRARGVRIAIDDFGTGYSSLAYLKRFPLDALKIDRGFISDLPDDSDDAAITLAIIAMAHSLKLNVLAEGVETEAQLNFLQEASCDFYQGYLKSPAISAQDFEQLLKAEKRL